VGARGPAPLPTNIKRLNGNPGHRPLNVAEPKPLPIAPECPSWLDKEAKKEWKRVAPELERLGLLTKVDGTALQGYCQAYATWKQCTEALQKHGLVMETQSGYLQQRPEVSIGNKALDQVRAFCIQFGLTPSARARMTLPESGDGDNEGTFDF